jgi:predicted  nucleic acid-binding Zn-ribbon protein
VIAVFGWLSVKASREARDVSRENREAINTVAADQATKEQVEQVKTNTDGTLKDLRSEVQQLHAKVSAMHQQKDDTAAQVAVDKAEALDKKTTRNEGV